VREVPHADAGGCAGQINGKGLPTSGLLANLLVAKHSDHLLLEATFERAVWRFRARRAFETGVLAWSALHATRETTSR
jgi:hypothetical protein